MRTLLAFVLVAAMACGAIASNGPLVEGGPWVGLFWAPQGQEPAAFTDAHTNIDFVAGEEVNLWLVLLGDGGNVPEEVKTFEAQIRVEVEGSPNLFPGDPVPVNDGVWFPVGSQTATYRNFQIVYVAGFVQTDHNGTLLAHIPHTSFNTTATFYFEMTGFAPTIGDPMKNPRIFDSNDQPVWCQLAIDADDIDPYLGWGTVATANGEGAVIPTEDLTLTNVKALFR